MGKGKEDGFRKRGLMGTCGSPDHRRVRDAPIEPGELTVVAIGGGDHLGEATQLASFETRS